MRGKTRHAHVVVAVWSVACDAVQVERLVVVLHRRRPLWRLHHVELVLTLHVLLVLLQLLCSATRVVSQKNRQRCKDGARAGAGGGGDAGIGAGGGAKVRSVFVVQ